MAIYGNFSAPKAQEVVVVRGTSLELLRPDDITGKILSVSSVNCFCVIRSIIAFRLTGATKDYIVVGSDAGKISILEFDGDLSKFKSVHLETFGKTGCRRIVPGQYLAVDPKGRAIMIAAVEKQKLVYVMNRDASSRLTISSPLEAHKAQTIVYSVAGVDVGFENPVFAVIELEYTEADQDSTGEAVLEAEKHLTYYELDLGLNHVVRKWSEPISRTANMLLTVPGGQDGPSGVLVVGENWVAYKHMTHQEIRSPLPRRAALPSERGTLVVSAATHRQKDLFFWLLQTEYGDIYKVTLELGGSLDEVQNVNVSVFDTIPTAASLCITKTGLLFAASEFGNHYLFQFQGMADDPDTVTAKSVMDPELGDDSLSAATVAPQFHPSTTLKNLVLFDEMESLSPIIQMAVADYCLEETPQVYCLCGRGNRSSLRVLRHGIAVTEVVVSEMPGHPSAVWTIKERLDSEFDRYIIVSFTNATLVLSIGETVEEVMDSGFLGTEPTLSVALLLDNSMIQIHAHGIRHINQKQEAAKRMTEWKTPGKKLLEKASPNTSQLAVALAGGEIIYFELTPHGQLQEVATKDLGVEVSCLDIGEPPEGRVKSSYMVVGGWDNTIRVLSLEEGSYLEPKSTMTLPVRAESLCLVQMFLGGSGGKASAADHQLLSLHVGLINGTAQRVSVDMITGTLSDPRTRFLGGKPVRLFRVMVQGHRGVLALSSRPWLSHAHQGRTMVVPLSYQQLDYASTFASEQCAEGLVAVAGNTLRILTLDRLGDMFNQTSIPLRYTPRKMTQVPHTSRLLIVEADHNEFNASEREKIEAEAREKTSAPQVIGMDTEDETTNMVIKGPMPPTEGKWASCIRLLDPKSGDTLELLELADNEATFSITTCVFHSRGGESFVCVGTARHLRLHPRRHGGCFIHVYRLFEDRLVLLHKTEVDEVPLAMCEFQGRLLVGIGRSLRVYDLGKKKLLRKCENKNFPTMITDIKVQADRIYVTDMMESFQLVKYKRSDNSLVIFADDQTPRSMSACELLDYDTMVGATKFGDIFIARVPADVSDEIDNPTGNRILWDTGLLNGAPNKLDNLAHFHIGDVITSLTKTALVPGGSEAILFSTIQGSIGALVPFTTREDVDFFSHLEMYMRQEKENLCGRDHTSYRSYFLPVKECVDGDLAELFSTLSAEKQKQIASDLDRTVGEVLKKLEDTRNRLL